jgi:hypothetical protein
VRPDRDRERKEAIRRDLYVAGAAVLGFMGVGALLTFMYGDAARLAQSVRSIVLSEPMPVDRIEVKAPPPMKVEGCKYCITLKTIQMSFAAKAEAAKVRHAAAQRAAEATVSDPAKAQVAAKARQADLADAIDAMDRNGKAAAALAAYTEVCEQEAFCKPDFAVAKGPVCAETVDDAAWRGPVMGLAAEARDAALGCAAAECASIDCGQAAALRHDLLAAAHAMSQLGGPVAASRGQPALPDLPVGAATLANEINKSVKDVEYVAKLFPALIERSDPKTSQRAAQMPAMVVDMSARQAEAIRNAAEVMSQAAVVTPFPQDVRREASWRMKALSMSVTAAGQAAAPEFLNGPEAAAAREALAQNWGAALVDLAAVTAMLDRVKAEAMSATGCNGQTAAAAQAARDAAALLDICRARASCPISAGEQTIGPIADADAARAALADLIPRAQSAASVLAAAQGPAPAATPNGGEMAQVALVLNVAGVCRRSQ